MTVQLQQECKSSLTTTIPVRRCGCSKPTEFGGPVSDGCRNRQKALEWNRISISNFFFKHRVGPGCRTKMTSSCQKASIRTCIISVGSSFFDRPGREEGTHSSRSVRPLMTLIEIPYSVMIAWMPYIHSIYHMRRGVNGLMFSRLVDLGYQKNE